MMSPGSFAPLPSGWECHKTAEGIPYYFNRVTGVSSWTAPTPPPSIYTSQVSNSVQFPQPFPISQVSITPYPSSHSPPLPRRPTAPPVPADSFTNSHTTPDIPGPALQTVPLSSYFSPPAVPAASVAASRMSPSSMPVTPSFSHKDRVFKLEAQALCGDGRAMLTLGKMLREDGDGLDAARWLRKATTQRVPGAALELALLYLSGEAYAAEPIQIVKMLLEGDKEDAVTVFVLALLLRSGISGLGEKEASEEAELCEAFARSLGIDRLLRERTQVSGCASDSLYLYGMALRVGVGIGKDIPDAAVWLSQAADSGHADATYQLAEIYLQNDYGHDAHFAFNLFSNSARRGNPAAQWRVGHMLASGTHCASGLKRPAEARRWFRKSALQGHIKGLVQWALTLEEETDNLDCIEAREALNMLGGALRRGDPEARLVYGIFLMKGIGILLDEDTAAREFQAAAEAGLPEAMTKYGECLKHGVGVEKNVEEGQHWLKKASHANYQVHKTAEGEASKPVFNKEFFDAALDRLTRLHQEFHGYKSEVSST